MLCFVGFCTRYVLEGKKHEKRLSRRHKRVDQEREIKVFVEMSGITACTRSAAHAVLEKGYLYNFIANKCFPQQCIDFPWKGVGLGTYTAYRGTYAVKSSQTR